MVSTGTLPQDIGTTFKKSFRSYLANPPPKNHFGHIRRAVPIVRQNHANARLYMDISPGAPNHPGKGLDPPPKRAMPK